MHIDISPIQNDLDIVESIVGRQEYSGFGWIQKIGDKMLVYDFELLHVGSEGFTDIKPEKFIALIDRPDNQNMRLWLHKHPCGNGIPGSHNWSGVDHRTCTETPLGGIPEMMKWSAAIVHTPRGWVGRIENHLKKKTFHVPVVEYAPWRTERLAQDLLNEYMEETNGEQHVYGLAFGELEPEPNAIQAVFDWVRSKV